MKSELNQEERSSNPVKNVGSSTRLHPLKPTYYVLQSEMNVITRELKTVPNVQKTDPTFNKFGNSWTDIFICHKKCDCLSFPSRTFRRSSREKNSKRIGKESEGRKGRKRRGRNWIYPVPISAKYYVAFTVHMWVCTYVCVCATYCPHCNPSDTCMRECGRGSKKWLKISRDFHSSRHILIN